jgi:hypothetical protein
MGASGKRPADLGEHHACALREKNDLKKMD